MPWVEQRLAHTLHQAELMGHAKDLSELHLGTMHPWQSFRLGLDAIRLVF